VKDQWRTKVKRVGTVYCVCTVRGSGVGNNTTRSKFSIGTSTSGINPNLTVESINERNEIHPLQGLVFCGFRYECPDIFCCSIFKDSFTCSLFLHSRLFKIRWSLDFAQAQNSKVVSCTITRRSSQKTNSNKIFGI
jgi:hypothetical protein